MSMIRFPGLVQCLAHLEDLALIVCPIGYGGPSEVHPMDLNRIPLLDALQAGCLKTLLLSTYTMVEQRRSYPRPLLPDLRRQGNLEVVGLDEQFCPLKWKDDRQRQPGEHLWDGKITQILPGVNEDATLR